MFDFLKRKTGGWPISLTLMAFCAVTWAPAFPGGIRDALAQTPKPEGWYRLRTNSVPYQPQNVTLDAAGGVWVSAQDGVEYAPGVWHRPAAAPPGPFQYFTNDRRNNLLSSPYNPPIEKPQLDASILYVIGDKEGNTWYALKNRKVLCEKADHGWLTFNMPDSSIYQPGVDTTNVDSAHRIRLIDKPDGTQEKLLIANRGILRVDAAFSVVETRQVYQTYNNDFIRDALIDSQGRYWVTSERGVEKGTSLVNTTYVSALYPSDPNAATGTMITRIVEDSLGNIWFGSDSYSGDGIYRFTTDEQWNKFAGGLVNTIGKKVHDIAAGHDGTVWFGAVLSGDGGLLRYDPAGGGQWTRYTPADLGLESGEIASLAFDGQGLWFVTAYNPGVPGNGTGVHYLTFNQQGQPNVAHYTYRASSTALTTLRLDAIAADLSGGVWFPAYDDPSIARLKADGSWQQFRQSGTSVNLGSFGFAGVAVDSKNRVYFAPTNAAPIAYDVAAERWLDLPAMPFTDFYYYGVHVDPQDGKWFHGAYFVYYLNPENTAWTSFSPAELPQFPGDYYVNSVFVDDAGNAWFMCRREIVLMKKNPEGAPSWLRFTSGDGSGYTGGYRVYQDDAGQVWSADKKKFDSAGNSWVTAADTSALDHRHLRFLNGNVPVDMDMSGALPPVSVPEELNMTVDSRGTIYFSGSLGNTSAGIVAFGPLNGDVDRNGIVNLVDAIIAARVIAGMNVQAFAGADVNGDGGIGLAEAIFALQKAAGMR